MAQFGVSESFCSSLSVFFLCASSVLCFWEFFGLWLQTRMWFECNVYFRTFLREFLSDFRVFQMNCCVFECFCVVVADKLFSGDCCVCVCGSSVLFTCVWARLESHIIYYLVPHLFAFPSPHNTFLFSPFHSPRLTYFPNIPLYLTFFFHPLFTHITSPSFLIPLSLTSPHPFFNILTSLHLS